MANLYLDKIRNDIVRKLQLADISSHGHIFEIVNNYYDELVKKKMIANAKVTNLEANSDYSKIYLDVIIQQLPIVSGIVVDHVVVEKNN